MPIACISYDLSTVLWNKVFQVMSMDFFSVNTLGQQTEKLYLIAMPTVPEQSARVQVQV